MSDDPMMNGSAPMPPAGPQSVLPPAPRSNGNMGRNILIGAAGLVVLAAIIGIVAYVLLSATVAPSPTITPTGPSAGGTGTTATGTILPIPDVTNADIFTPRNPFKVIRPIMIEVEEPASSTDTSSTALTLVDITTSNGEKVAVVKLGGQTYTVGEGDQVGTSDWQVVTIHTSSVVFLYGDETITISLGQGTSK